MDETFHEITDIILDLVNRLQLEKAEASLYLTERKFLEEENNSLRSEIELLKKAVKTND